MSKFDFVREVKKVAVEEFEKSNSQKQLNNRPDGQNETHNSINSIFESDQKREEAISVQVSLPTGNKKQAKRNQRQMTIHEDVYQAAATYAKKEGMSVSRLFETVMAQALKVDID